MKTILWLDDLRNPFKEHQVSIKWVCLKCLGIDIKDVDVVWVKTQSEFENYIKENGLPDFISFDNDLGIGNGEGYDCAKFLVEYCLDNDLNIPLFYSHSANPVAKDNIEGLLTNFEEHTKK